MKAEHISDALNQLPDDMLDEASAVRNGGKRPRRAWAKWLAAAACLALAVWVGNRWLHTVPSLVEPYAVDLPKLPLSEGITHPSGMGFEGYLAYDVSELVSGSPWRETDRYQTLPVYRNPVEYDGAGAPIGGVDLDAMKARALEVAERLGAAVELEDNAPSEEEIAAVWEKLGEIPEGYFDPTEVTARGDGVEITVEADLTAGIFFEPALELPEEYNFGYYAPYEDMKEVSDYLLGRYRGLLAMENPQAVVAGGDRNIYGEQTYQIEFYDAGGDKTQRLLNYSFSRAHFSCDEEGKLWIIRLDGTNLSQKVGDYPVITPEQAKDLLLEGRYITNVPYELPGKEYVKAVELLYRSGRREEYFMPYYRFLVEVPEAARENGLKSYGAYYVPAVEEECLTGLPVWDGGFN